MEALIGKRPYEEKKPIAGEAVEAVATSIVTESNIVADTTTNTAESAGTDESATTNPATN